jgi:hypothetical protein
MTDNQQHAGSESEQPTMSLEEQLYEVTQDKFDDLMSDYELDSTMSIDDMLYEMFALGFETGLIFENEEEENKQ